MILFVNGDSNAAGYEMVPPGTTFDVMEQKPIPPLTRDEMLAYQAANRWSTLVSKQFGWSCCNIACPGSSNGKIFRTTLQWISENLSNLRDHFVIVGWSAVTRREYFLEKNNHWNDFGLNFKPVHQIEQKAFESLVSPRQGFIELWQYKASLHNILKNHGVPHLFFNSYEAPSLVYGSYLRNLIDEDIIINTVMAEYCREKNCRVGRGGHFLEDGHAAWAEEIIKNIRRVYEKTT